MLIKLSGRRKKSLYEQNFDGEANCGCCKHVFAVGNDVISLDFRVFIHVYSINSVTNRRILRKK